MAVGEAAAYLASEAIARDLPPGRIGADRIIRRLAERGFLLTFFNDIENHRNADWYPAVQYFGTKGFLPTCDARPLDPLSAELAEKWIASAVKIRGGGSYDAMEAAQECARIDDSAGPFLNGSEFLEKLGKAIGKPAGQVDAKEQPITRGAACRVLFGVAGDG